MAKQPKGSDSQQNPSDPPKPPEESEQQKQGGDDESKQVDPVTAQQEREAEEQRKRDEEAANNLSAGARGENPEKSPDKEDDKDRKVGVTDYSELDPSDDRYDPYQDPAVESSAIADVVAQELRADGKSPTLDECRKAYKKRQEAQENA